MMWCQIIGKLLEMNRMLPRQHCEWNPNNHEDYAHDYGEMLDMILSECFTGIICPLLKYIVNDYLGENDQPNNVNNKL